jgi:hypothetical protein
MTCTLELTTRIGGFMDFWEAAAIVADKGVDRAQTEALYVVVSHALLQMSDRMYGDESLSNEQRTAIEFACDAWDDFVGTLPEGTVCIHIAPVHTVRNDD